MKKIYLNTLTPEEIIKRLKGGEVIHIFGTENNSYKMIDGILCSCYNNRAYILGVSLDIENDDNCFEEQEEFKVEKTGLYKTRDGRVAFVSSVWNDAADGIIEGSKCSTRWYNSGKYFKVTPCADDLVEYVGD